MRWANIPPKFIDRCRSLYLYEWFQYASFHLSFHTFYWATLTGEAQFKIRSFICVRNGIPMGRLFCWTISLASSRSLRDVQFIWRAVIGFNWKWRNTSPLYVFSAVSWSVRFVGKGKSICMKFACLSYHSLRSFHMVDGGKSCFRSSERRVVSTPP